MSNVAPIPSGFNTLTPYLIVEDAEAALELYMKALGAEVVRVHKLPNGKIMNAQLQIGNSLLMLTDEWPDYGAIGPKKVGGTSVTIHIYTDNVDALWARAVASGFEVDMKLDNAPWGDRYGSMRDPFGHSWSMATHIEDVSEEELAKRMANIG